MARRKFRRSSTSRRRSGSTKVKSRRRRIGATSALNFSATSPLVKWGSVALGFLKPDLIPIGKLVGDKIDPKIVSGGQVGLGFLLAMRKGKKSLPMVILGGYLLGSGAKGAMTAFGIGGIGPYGRVPVIGQAGPYGMVPVINGRRVGGYTPNNSLNGYNPHGTINRVVSGVGSGSGLSNGDPGSDCMN